jgi:hypothetical protein
MVCQDKGAVAIVSTNDVVAIVFEIGGEAGFDKFVAVVVADVESDGATLEGGARDGAGTAVDADGAAGGHRDKHLHIWIGWIKSVGEDWVFNRKSGSRKSPQTQKERKKRTIKHREKKPTLFATISNRLPHGIILAGDVLKKSTLAT